MPTVKIFVGGPDELRLDREHVIAETEEVSASLVDHSVFLRAIDFTAVIGDLGDPQVQIDRAVSGFPIAGQQALVGRGRGEITPRGQRTCPNPFELIVCLALV